MIYAFGDCELDTGRVSLLRGGTGVHIEPQVFDLLVFLIEQRNRVVAKEELLDELWGDRFVSESALTTQIKSARRAVADDGTRQDVIRTVHGRGYRFVASVIEASTSDLVAVSTRKWLADADLPVPMQSLIGREVALQELSARLESARLVTLIGPAGVGKTSLAFELARTLGRRYADGVFAVELVSVVDADATVQALATTLHVHARSDGSLEDAIVDFLRPRHTLLLLDNCEHLVEPERPTRASSSPSPTPRPWSRSAADSTASHWPSNWRRPGPGPSM